MTAEGDEHIMLPRALNNRENLHLKEHVARGQEIEQRVYTVVNKPRLERRSRRLREHHHGKRSEERGSNREVAELRIQNHH